MSKAQQMASGLILLGFALNIATLCLLTARIIGVSAGSNWKFAVAVPFCLVSMWLAYWLETQPRKALDPAERRFTGHIARAWIAFTIVFFLIAFWIYVNTGTS